MSDLTVAAGSDAALVFTFAGALDATPTIAIVDSDDSSIVASTSTGVGDAGSGVYTYVWQTSSGQAADIYTATMSGLLSTAAVSEDLTVTVTNLPTYTTLALVRASLNDATGRDTLLQQKIASASRSIDNHTGRRFYLDATVTARILNPRSRVRGARDGERLLIDDVGELTGFKIETGSTSTGWTDITSQVETEPTDALAKSEPVTSLLYQSGRWSTLTRVRVTARWGWPAVPDVVQEAALIQSLRLFRRKDSPEGVLGSAEWGTVRVSRLDPDVAKLLENYVKDGFA